ncbi:hypothetical protein SDC9_194542 [bioreactor metagenome]|uniref:Uncharacterized protein n=1 Tax=bioreactor metagenome TaxID=1076179 RepID=A0A645IHX2_9ZZZZ
MQPKVAEFNGRLLFERGVKGETALTDMLEPHRGRKHPLALAKLAVFQIVIAQAVKQKAKLVRVIAHGQ